MSFKDSHVLVVDDRSGKTQQVPIIDGTVKSDDLNNIKTCSNKFQSPNESKEAAGLLVWDNELRNVAVGNSSVSRLDALAGTLHYRNQNIFDLVVQKYSFENVLSLLIWNKFPLSGDEHSELSRSLAQYMLDVPEDLFRVINQFPRSSHAIFLVTAGISAVAGTQPAKVPITGQGKSNQYSRKNMEHVDNEILHAIATQAVATAVAHCHQTGQTYQHPLLRNTYIQNTMRMMNLHSSSGVGTSKTSAGQEVYEHRLTTAMMMYMEHGMATSTVAFLAAASTRADPLSCLVSGWGAIAGPLHGGAIEIVYHMLREIGQPDNAQARIDSAKARRDVLYGFGHRIYKTTDPRSKVLGKLAKELTDDADAIQKQHPRPSRIEGKQRSKISYAIGDEDEARKLAHTALKLDRLVSGDEWFLKRQVRTGADLYTALCFPLLGVPATSMMAIICAARCVGLLAHWRELLEQNPGVWRPTHVYKPSATVIDRTKSKL